MSLRRLPGEALIGVGLAVLGLGMAWSASRLDVSAAYAKVGPAVIPYIVAAGLVVVGSAIAWTKRNEIDATSPSDFVALFSLSAGILGYALILKTAGFIVSSAILFFLVAWGFGIRHHVANTAIAIALAVAVFVLFQYGLGLNLPLGPLEALLP